MEELMIKIDNVSKQYKLGQIGGTTLREELQRKRAKRRGLEDPTKKIGSKDYVPGETFMALNGVSFEVKKGERVGIIGHNGAGKSTLLKLLSRVTAPTGGEIGLNGRVASMLEVGTGFHGELTGRENIYMNGAILGMTKAEIDSKIEDIIDFSEVRQFIDTPVKRYSSGMYVKLAFSVAAHLDSEIMIMDEVLAVGDMAFQKKCLDKMNDVSRTEERTILYVSHNMNTIRQLCDRVIVLDHGKLIYDGGVEEGISVYMNNSRLEEQTDIDLDKVQHWGGNSSYDLKLHRIVLKDKISPIFYNDEKIKMHLYYSVEKKHKNVFFRVTIKSQADFAVGLAISETFNADQIGDKEAVFEFDCKNLYFGKYYASIGLYILNDDGSYQILDHVTKAIDFEIIRKPGQTKLICDKELWGYAQFPDMQVVAVK